MNPKTVIHFKGEQNKDGPLWRIRRGGQKFEFFHSFSRLFRMLSTLILDKDAVISGRLEVIRKKKT